MVQAKQIAGYIVSILQHQVHGLKNKEEHLQIKKMYDSEKPKKVRLRKLGG
ncbi:21408_t:CDS:2 [Rhizophagus irregularis]|nr:21408_t:CDS:2 [Rhizophagus irregularis]